MSCFQNKNTSCNSPPLSSASVTTTNINQNLDQDQVYSNTINGISNSVSSTNNNSILSNASTDAKTKNLRVNNGSRGSASRTSSNDDHETNIDSDNPNADAYKERRRKNNEAAKRSRDARRAKEDDIALRAAILERENLQLKVELSQLKIELNQLRCLLYNS